jgi:hypothetical protein
MANPASVFCEEQGFQLEIRTIADGSQAGVCIFPDGSECDEWAYFRGECAPPGINNAVEPPGRTPALQITPQEVSLPAGVLLNRMAESGLSLYSLGGEASGKWVTSQPAPLSSTHLAGPAISDSASTPLVFASTENGVAGLKVSQAGEISSLLEFPNSVILTDLIGAPGSPWVAYSVIEPQADGSNLVSKLYVGVYNHLAQVQPALVIENKESRILKPVALHRDGSTPIGVWFTYTLFGIGGDSFTAPNAGLYYLDLANGSTDEFLSLDQRFSSLSPDQTHVAWTPALPNAPMTMTDLTDRVRVTFPLLENQDRGAVHAFISPDNTRLAWMEASGNAFDGTLKATLRLGTADGAITGEYPDLVLAASSGSGEGATILPMGWSDNQTLIAQIYLPGKEEQGEVIRLDVISGEISPLAPGIFVEFAYP